MPPCEKNTRHYPTSPKPPKPHLSCVWCWTTIALAVLRMSKQQILSFLWGQVHTYFGCGGNTTCLHADPSENLLLVVMGEKFMDIYPPCDAACDLGRRWLRRDASANSATDVQRSWGLAKEIPWNSNSITGEAPSCKLVYKSNSCIPRKPCFTSTP